MPYYALHIPPKGTSNVISNTNCVNDPGLPNYNSTDSALVFREKAKALEVLKQYKEARLKEFPNEDDALEYAQTGYEIVNSRYNDIKSSTAAVEKAAFRAPLKQELAEFRKCIEGGDYDRVTVIIWENPRFLVSSGDTPTSLKEGCRYNAMHICALYKRTQIAELILKTVSNTEFADLLIGKKNDHKSSKELAINLLDYYLNMPEKGRSETPLHLASKIGCVDMVELLTSYPECKMNPNKDGHFPKDIICTRAPIGGSPEIAQKIKSLLEERFYVPVLRSMDGAVPPQIGQPFSTNNPPNLNADPLSPEVKIQALAGPMNKDQAIKFCRRWKTPPRIGTSSPSAIASSPFISPIKGRLNKTSQHSPGKPKTLFMDSPSIRRRSLFDSPLPKECHDNDDSINDLLSSLKEKRNHKSLNDLSPKDPNPEEEDKTNNNQTEIPKLDEQEKTESTFFPTTPLLIKPRPMFLQYREQVVDSPMTMHLIPTNSSIASEKEIFDSPGYQERHIKITNTEKGLEMIGRQLAKEQNVDWREYWDFLNSFVDITSPDGLQQLESYFAQQKKETELKKKSAEFAFNSVVVLDEVCSALEKFGFKKDVKKNGFTENQLEDLTCPTLQQSTTPYTCIEKSLQVFAKRITKTITINVENVTSINDILLSELKRLKSLICSFKEDSRFLNVDFTKVHSRIANLVAYYLNRSQEVNFSVKIKIQQILENLANLPGERREHIECVCAKIIAFFEQPILDDELPENIKNEEMCSSTWHGELSCNCIWESNLSRKTSRRQRMEIRLKQIKEAENQKRLMKELKTESKGNLDSFQSNSVGNDSSDELEDVFWSDCDVSESDDEDDFYTPLQSPSRLSLLEEKEVEDPYKLFIYGDEPTKRDLDVINAIFNVHVDESKYPNIHAWRTAMSRYPTEVMDQFPSPAIIRKFPSLKLRTPKLCVSKKDQPRTPYHHRHFVLPHNATSTPTDNPLQNTKTQVDTNVYKTTQSLQNSSASEQLPLAKRLFMSPLRKTPIGAIQETKKLFTPLGKLRGLFTQYRDTIDGSPLSSSSSSASNSDTERDNSMNLPVSTAE